MLKPRFFFRSTLSCLLSLLLVSGCLMWPGPATGVRAQSRRLQGRSALLSPAQPAAVYVVNSTADPGVGTCDAIECTLREAITASNASASVLDTINFQIGSGPQTITPLTALPQITDPVVIDATTQPGYAGTPIIELNGSSTSGAAGLYLTAGGSAVRGLVINRFATGIRIDLKGSNIIEGNYIGTNIAGSLALPNANGILIGNSDLFGFGQTNNRIGGSTPAARNLISGNTGNAISLSGNLAQGSTAGHSFIGNYIGTNASGTAALGNGGDGINITFNSSGAISNNVISGNLGSGVSVSGSNTGAAVAGNFIGTSYDGTAAIGNTKTGVFGAVARTQGVTVGGTTTAARNIISNNGQGGVSLTCDASASVVCLVQGNYIGTDVTGNVAMGNTGPGVSFAGGNNNGIGGTTAGAGNLISANTGNGVTLNSGNVGGGFVQGNRIGTNAAGTGPLGNGQHGIALTDASFSFTIGGTAAGAGNIIAFNGGKGITTAPYPTGDTILSNSIYSNGSLGIDLWDDGVSPNDNCDGGGSGASPLQNYPVITSATTSGGSTTIQGMLNSKPNQSYTIQFFSSPACDPSGYGEGANLLGSTTVTTNAGCTATFNVTFPATTNSGDAITATTTNSANWTSEFSQCKLVDRFIISGRITTPAGIPLSNVPVNLAGSQTATTFTDAGGNYSFAVIPGGSYTVTPARRSLIYTPASRAFNSIGSDQFGADFTARLRQPSDFDGDGRTDIAVWRPTTGDWDYYESSTGLFKKQLDWGRASLGDIPVPADYDGDGRTDFAVWRSGEGNWYVIRSSNGAVAVYNWGGGNNDTPAPADFDGDGLADLVVFRRTEGNWYVKLSSNGSTRAQGWGNSTDKLVPGDYDGDGLADFAVWRPEDGNWYIIQSSTNTVRIQQWGIGGDRPVPGDYDGDTKTDIAVWRPSDGNWYIIKSTGGGVVRNWGDQSDVPVPGDYDGDGRIDIAIFRPSENTWYIIQSGTNSGRQNGLGATGDVPVPSMYIPQ